MHRELEVDGFRRFAQIGPLYELSSRCLEEAVVTRRPTRPRIVTPAARPPTAGMGGPRIRSIEVPSRRTMLRIWSGLRRQRAPLILLDDDDNDSGEMSETQVATITAAQRVPTPPPQEAPEQRAPPTPPVTPQSSGADNPAHQVEVGGVRISVPPGLSRYRIRVGDTKFALRLDPRTGRVRHWSSRQLNIVIILNFVSFIHN